MMARWRYEDARGVEQEGEFEQSFDYGGTDVTYKFRRDDGGIDLVSGPRLKRAVPWLSGLKRIGTQKTNGKHATGCLNDGPASECDYCKS